MSLSCRSSHLLDGMNPDTLIEKLKEDLAQSDENSDVHVRRNAVQALPRGGKDDPSEQAFLAALEAKAPPDSPR